MATIKDIAKEAGVSHGTVSNVLNKTGKVSAEKIQLVEAAAKRLGYKLNTQARQLRGGSSKNICVILPNLQMQCYVDLYDKIQAIFSGFDYQVILFTTDRIPSSEKKAWDKTFALRPDAVICSTCLETIPDLDTIEFPIILIDYNQLLTNPTISYACFDFVKAAEEITELVKRKGYKNIALFSTSGKSASKTIFSNTLTKLLGNSVSLTPFSSDDKLMFHKSFEIIHSHPKFDLVITFHAEQAECVYQAASYTSEAQFPDIITISSYKTIPDSRFLSYELNYKYLGKQIAETLLESFRSKEKKPLHFELKNEGFRYLFSNLSTPNQNAPCHSINILSLESPASNALKMLLPDFERRTGIQANLTILAFDELYDTISTMGGSGYYDLIRSDVAWMSHLAEKTYLPLSQLPLDLSEIFDSLIDEAKNSFSSAEQTRYTLPFDPSIQMLFYRNDLFEDAMIKRQYYELYKEELSVPKTFEQYNKTAAFFTKSINPDSPVDFGTTLTFGSAGVAACDFLPRLLAMGKSVFNQNGLLAINTPDCQTAMKNYIETYRYTDRSNNKWWKQSVENFSQGNTAMTITFSNHASYLINSKHSNVVDRLGFDLVPGGKPLLGGGVIGISKASHHVKESCEFLKWVYSDEISNMLTILGGTSANRSIYTNGEIISLFPWLETAKSCFRFGSRRAESRRYPLFNEKTFENILGSAVRSSVTGMMSIESALSYAQQIAEQTFQPG